MKGNEQYQLVLTAHGRHSTVGRLLLVSLLLFTFVGGARASQSTFTKDILGFGENTGGNYHLIASPLKDEVSPDNVSDLIYSDHYDLYSFDSNAEDGNEWRNYKENGFNLIPGKGYLYAKCEDVVLTFTGEPFDDDEFSIDVVEGWNLLGNPFSNSDGVYLVNEEGKGLTFYAMNDEGSAIEMVEGGRPIGPMEGFFYYATEEGTVRLVANEPEGWSGDGECDAEFLLPEHGVESHQNAFQEDEEPQYELQVIPLAKGWNWVSFNVDISLYDLEEALNEAAPVTTITINSQGRGSTTYNGRIWRGGMSNLDVTNMYMIKVTDDCEVVLEAYPIDLSEHPVTIKQGDNWIAFPLNQPMNVADVFEDFPVQGDMVRSQTAFAFFDGNYWKGSLTVLEPGKGYIYFSASEEEREYCLPQVEEASIVDYSRESYWPDFDYHVYQFNQPFVASIQIDGSTINCDDERWESLEVAAFVGDECRGHAFMDGRGVEYGDPYPVVELPIYYNSEGEVITFKLFDHTQKIEYAISNVSHIGEDITVQTGEDHMEAWFAENPIFLNFSTPPFDGLELADDDWEKEDGEKNMYLISNNPENPTNVKLAGRTLLKDGHFSTICLPFDVTIENCELFEDAKVMELDTDETGNYDHATGFEGGTLYLNFKEIDGTMEAGKPYLIKWDVEGDPIVDPIFYDVEFTAMNLDENAVTSADNKVTFMGTFSSLKIDGENKSMLYLGDEDKLFYPEREITTIGAFRAYFQLNGGITAGEMSEARLSIGGSDASGIEDVHRSSFNVQRDPVWYALDGRQLQGKPAKKGIYVREGRKVVVK